MGNPTDETVARLEADWPSYQIWDSAEHLAEALADEAER